VVLQRFRGELTLLDSRNRGGEAGEERASGGSFGRTSPMEQRRPATVGGGRMSDALDDDIPF
jgi:single-strand DNA-binding protein